MNLNSSFAKAFGAQLTNIGSISPWACEVNAVKEIPQSQLGIVAHGMLLDRNVARGEKYEHDVAGRVQRHQHLNIFAETSS